MKAIITALALTINEELARSAHYANSFRQYREGESRQRFEAQALNFVNEVTEEKAEKHPHIKEQLENILTSLAAWYNKNNSIEASCPSVMISGAANFPVKKKERQNAARTNHWEAFKKLQERVTKLAKWQPKDAETMQDQLTMLIELHASCIECNKYYRKHGTLSGFEFVNEKQKRDAYFHIGLPYHDQPFASYNLTSIKNKIKRLQANQEAASKSTEEHESDFFRIETTDERINLYLNERVDKETFALFRKNGFLWSSRNQCFTRQNTLNAHHSLRRLNADLLERARV